MEERKKKEGEKASSKLASTMKAGNILGNACIPWKPTLPPHLPPPLSTFRCFSALPSSSSLVPNPPLLSFTCIEFDVVLSLSLSHFILFYVYCTKKKTKIKPKRDWAADWISNNDDTVRGFPIFFGGASLLAVLVNRAVTGIAPVADASR
jgi:hypothetical protein